MTSHKFVLKDTGQTHGVITVLPGVSQPSVDSSGNINMGDNYLKAKTIEVGIQDFTVNDNTTDNKGVINVFSDSSANKVANINFKNTNTYKHLYQNENSRSYSEYQTIVDSSNITTGIISGGNFQTTFGVLMDDNLMELCDSRFTYGGDNPLYSTGKYTVPDRGSTFYIDGTGGAITYDTWLQQINALTPYTYYYKTTTTSNGKFNASYRQSPTSSFQSNAYIPYQGFLGSEVLNVYPPAVINSSSDSSNNQYVDMSKLIPMCIGAIKQLDASMNSLSTKIADLETLNLLNSWQITRGTTELSALYTTKDGVDGFNEYLMKRKTLTSVKWGSNQYNSLLDDTQRQIMLHTQLTAIIQNNTSKDIPSDTKFIYKFTEITPNPAEPWIVEYTYSFYTISAGGTQLSEQFDVQDQTGKFGLIYDTSL